MSMIRPAFVLACLLAIPAPASADGGGGVRPTGSAAYKTARKELRAVLRANPSLWATHNLRTARAAALHVLTAWGGGTTSGLAVAAFTGSAKAAMTVGLGVALVGSAVMAPDTVSGDFLAPQRYRTAEQAERRGIISPATRERWLRAGLIGDQWDRR